VAVAPHGAVHRVETADVVVHRDVEEPPLAAECQPPEDAVQQIPPTRIAVTRRHTSGLHERGRDDGRSWHGGG
jgi:hypothetical protein